MIPLHTRYLPPLPSPPPGRVRCPICSTDLREDDGTAGLDPDVGRLRAERRRKMRDLLTRYDAQMKPLTDLLAQLQDIAPPDHGSLEQWAMVKRQQAEQARRAHEAAGGAGRGEIFVFHLYPKKKLILTRTFMNELCSLGIGGGKGGRAWLGSGVCS